MWPPHHHSNLAKRPLCTSIGRPRRSGPFELQRPHRPVSRQAPCRCQAMNDPHTSDALSKAFTGVMSATLLTKHRATAVRPKRYLVTTAVASRNRTAGVLIELLVSQMLPQLPELLFRYVLLEVQPVRRAHAREMHDAKQAQHEEHNAYRPGLREHECGSRGGCSSWAR